MSVEFDGTGMSPRAVCGGDYLRFSNSSPPWCRLILSVSPSDDGRIFIAWLEDNGMVMSHRYSGSERFIPMQVVR